MNWSWFFEANVNGVMTDFSGCMLYFSLLANSSHSIRRLWSSSIVDAAMIISSSTVGHGIFIHTYYLQSNLWAEYLDKQVQLIFFIFIWTTFSSRFVASQYFIQILLPNYPALHPFHHILFHQPPLASDSIGSLLPQKWWMINHIKCFLNIKWINGVFISLLSAMASETSNAASRRDFHVKKPYYRMCISCLGLMIQKYRIQYFADRWRYVG